MNIYSTFIINFFHCSVRNFKEVHLSLRQLQFLFGLSDETKTCIVSFSITSLLRHTLTIFVYT